MRAAADSGAAELVIGLGVSATSDGGAGLLAAVGMALLDAQGAALPPGPLSLHALDRVDGQPALRGVSLLLVTDVDHPLEGPGGIDPALARLAAVLERDLPGCPPGLSLLPGGAAGGGVGACLLALGARRTAGFDLVAERTGLADAIAGADLVLTGRGRFDADALRAGVCVGVARLALEQGVPCVVLAAQVAVGRREQAAVGVEESYSVAERVVSPTDSPADPAVDLASLAADVARTWSH